jgi:hypothetical protein
MAPTDTRPIIDRLLDGGLDKYLTDAREAGQSFATIAERLGTEHGVTVTAETVRNWTAKAKGEAE